MSVAKLHYCNKVLSHCHPCVTEHGVYLIEETLTHQLSARMCPHHAMTRFCLVITVSYHRVKHYVASSIYRLSFTLSRDILRLFQLDDMQK